MTFPNKKKKRKKGKTMKRKLKLDIDIPKYIKRKKGKKENKTHRKENCSKDDINKTYDTNKETQSIGKKYRKEYSCQINTDIRTTNPKEKKTEIRRKYLEYKSNMKTTIIFSYQNVSHTWIFPKSMTRFNAIRQPEKKTDVKGKKIR